MRATDECCPPHITKQNLPKVVRDSANSETVRQIMQPYISAVHSHNQEQSVEEVSKQAFRRHNSIYCKLLNGHSSGNRNVIYVHVIFNIQGCRRSLTQRLQLHVNNKRDNYNAKIDYYNICTSVFYTDSQVNAAAQYI